MTTVNVRFRPSLVEGRPGTLCYQVIRNRMVRRIASGYRIYPEEWDSKKLRILIPRSRTSRRAYLLKARAEVSLGAARLKLIVRYYESSKKTYTADDVAVYFHSPFAYNSWFNCMISAIQEMMQHGKFGTAEAYEAAYRSFSRFRKGKDLSLNEIESELMEQYEMYLRKKRIKANTSSFYMRNLRAVYNRMVVQGFVEQRFPFKRVYTGVGKTVKRAVSLQVMRAIKRFDVKRDKWLRLARDLFLFSFYTRGMSFVDMAFLKKTNLKGGVLSYQRKKTGQWLHIRWEPCMHEIVFRHRLPDSPYLLPIIRRDGNERQQYKNASRTMNRKLNEIGRELGLTAPLTMYVARHAWASIARSRNVPLAVISEGMGHDSERTTEIYLSSFSELSVDQVNRTILNLVK